MFNFCAPIIIVNNFEHIQQINYKSQALIYMCGVIYCKFLSITFCFVECKRLSLLKKLYDSMKRQHQRIQRRMSDLRFTIICLFLKKKANSIFPIFND